MAKEEKRKSQPSRGKRERYIQPSILMGLYLKSSYGYEIIKNIREFGFVEGQAPPGMIYRHLRQLENDGLVSSEWETQGSGPAKRMYRLTDEGGEVLSIWIEYMEQQAASLTRFAELYRKAQQKKL
jgi:poly-beta-hydroxybutyrate-responsive repressor